MRRAHCICVQMTPPYSVRSDPVMITDVLMRNLTRKKMRNWTDKWKVTFEPCKYKDLIVTRKRNPTRSDLLFRNIKLPHEDELEILGITDC